MTKRLTAAAFIFMCVIMFCSIMVPVRVRADEKQQFTGDAVLLRQDTTSGTFQITVSNEGEDFDGTVRFQMIADGGSNTYSAFDTKMVLAQGGQKQYILTIPVEDYEDSRGIASITFLDDKGEVLQQVQLTGILGDKAAKITVGILSEDFDALSYMQMAGQTYYVDNTDRDINLVDVSVSELKKSLSGLYFLVIDNFDMSVLDAKQIAAIEDWVAQGGWLIIGTGSRGEDMISAFSKGFLDLSYVSTTEAGKPNEASKILDKNQGDYTAYVNNGINLQDMAYSEFSYTGSNGYFSSEHPGWDIQIGQGSVLVLGISLSDPQMQSGGENVCYSLYDEVQYNSLKASNYDSYNGWSYIGSRAMSVIDRQSTDVNFTSLKILIIIYAILVGPILYVILRKAKKSEWYWVGIPILGVAFVGIVYLFGNGLQVKGIRACSVSVQEATNETDPDMETYLLGYHSGTKEWSTKLGDNYTYAGCAFSAFGTWKKAPNYTNHVVYDGDEIRIGANPANNFENQYIKAVGSGISAGTIDTDKLSLSSSAQSGTVTNNTNKDFPYVALQSNDHVLILTDVKAGETVDIAEAIRNNRYIYNQANTYLEDIFDSLIDCYNYGSNDVVEEKDVVSSLIVGMCEGRQHASDTDHCITVTGATGVSDQRATSEKNERAYSCFYVNVNAKQEVGNASN